MIYTNPIFSGSINVSGSMNVNGRSVVSLATPIISEVNYVGSVTAADPAGGETFLITGSNYESGVSVLIGDTAASSVSRISDTNLTITTPAKSAGDYNLTVTNTDGGTATVVNGISYNGVPSWSTPQGSIGSYPRSVTNAVSISLSVSEPDLGSITYSLKSGTLPPGLTLNPSTGVISGNTSDPGSETTYNFTISATDDENQATDRSFSITLRDNISVELTSTGNWTVPAGITSIQVELAAAGGGGGGGGSGGGCGFATGGSGAQGGTGASISYKGGAGSTGGNYTGGAGGAGGGSNYESPQTLSVTPGASLLATIGNGGAGGIGGYYRGGSAGGSMGGRVGSSGSPGQQTSFSSLTTSGTNNTSTQNGTAANGLDATLTAAINDQPSHWSDYNGRTGGTGAKGKVRITY